MKNHKGTTLTVGFIDREDDYQEEAATYLFDVSGETFGVKHTSYDEYSIVNANGRSINTNYAKYKHLLDLKNYITKEMRMA